MLCGTVVTGVAVLVCGVGFQDWHGYSGLQKQVDVNAAIAAEAKAAAQQAKESSAENRERISVSETRLSAIDSRTERMEQNLYEFLRRQPGLTPTPPEDSE